MSETEPQPKRHYSAGSTLALLIIGLLILVPSGLCTGAFGVMAIYSAITSPGEAGDSLSFIPQALIVGGPFVVGGGAMVWVAVKRMRGR